MVQMLPSVIHYYLACMIVIIANRTLNPELHFIDSALQMMKLNVVQNITYLARDEMKNIHQLDTEIIEQHKDKLKFYYGTTDGWCPLANYEKLCKNVNGVDAVVCNKEIDHAFMFKYTDVMAEIVCGWFNDEFKRKITGKDDENNRM